MIRFYKVSMWGSFFYNSENVHENPLDTCQKFYGNPLETCQKFEALAPPSEVQVTPFAKPWNLEDSGPPNADLEKRLSSFDYFCTQHPDYPNAAKVSKVVHQLKFETSLTRAPGVRMT